LTSFLINDTVAIDAGSLGFWNSPEDQARVRHVFLSHSHLDHIASLPIFLENVYGASPGVTIHASPEVMHCLERDLFNDRIWPDLNVLDPPFYRRQLLTAGQCVEVDGLRITPVPVQHVVPTVGFVVEDATAAVIFASDTAETDEIWRRANALPNLKAVFLEVTFPSSYASLAEQSQHLTPATFRREIRKLNRTVPVIVVHIKARFRGPVVQELRELGLAQAEIGESGRVYAFA
jgi:cAMP phosphodiesterase